MIERDFIVQKTKEYYIRKYIEHKLNKVGISSIKLKKIPLGEKIIIFASKPSLIVGSKGSNIRDLTRELKTEFKLENPQIEINEVKNVYLDPNIVAEKIALSLEKFGSARFKGVGHKMMENVINSGALGVEIVISGKIPSARAKSWRFYQGYLKKCGDIAIVGVKKSNAYALLKSGTVGIKVSIMPPDLELPDKIEMLSEPIMVIEPLGVGEKSEKNGKSSGVSKEKSSTSKPVMKRKSPLKKEPKEPKESKVKEMKEEIKKEAEEKNPALNAGSEN